MNDTVQLTFDGDVATLTIDRPDRLNALNEATLEGMADALDEARGEARVLVVTGAGEKAFAAGADISRMAEMSVEEAHAYCEQGHAVMNAVESFPAPVIAALNGYAFGGGCELALACDLRIASERAVIGQTEIDLGIVPGWGGTQRLVRLVGDETARRLVFFGERVDAQDALELDLVSEVVAHDELDEYVAGMAADLAEKPQFAMAAAKEAINEAHEMGQREGLDFERRLWSSLFGTPDQREGMDAFLNDRDPEFE
ncbi:enoyl-CoA hydratase/isomerase family protein [Halorarius halobius]|uniref:enoyl-CoA hydratase/isomerase family protein n=1 Tax=Halorarius halobius TaxID=2962671 RepID=UPI0020CC7B76|nr:enoyl-CoA hydratase-related protein [Halorarius halobius]